MPAGQNLEGSAESVRFSLAREDTAAILRGAGGARINDILLTALVLAYGEWTGEPALVVDLEGHGREELFDGADVTRTVGWFTSIFPVLLDVRGAPNGRQALKRVSDALARRPHNGAGYGVLRFLVDDPVPPAPVAAVSFNYWGRLAEDISGGGLFEFIGQDEGERRCPRNSRTHVFEINCHIVDGETHFDFTYSRNLHHRSSIAAFANLYAAALADLAKLPPAGSTSGRLDLSLIDLEDAQ